PETEPLAHMIVNRTETRPTVAWDTVAISYFQIPKTYYAMIRAGVAFSSVSQPKYGVVTHDTTIYRGKDTIKATNQTITAQGDAIPPARPMLAISFFPSGKNFAEDNSLIGLLRCTD